jgi:hypothetical protein
LPYAIGISYGGAARGLSTEAQDFRLWTDQSLILHGAAQSMTARASPAVSTDPFASDGWLVLDLVKGQGSLAFEVRDQLLQWLRLHWIAELDCIENYHLFVDDDERHIAIQHDLTTHYQSAGFGPALIEENLDFFRQLIGPDLHVQKFPYLRLARPGKRQDNIGIHRDTHYGGSPFELSVSIPFTDTGTAGALGVISGSHVLAESAFPVRQTVSPDVSKGSVKHQLGFLYAPKELDDTVRKKVTPVALRPGQALVFSLSLVHGQEVNRSQVTRFQSDARVVSSFAPIQWTRNVHADYYRVLCSSAVADQARRYLSANQASE